MNIHEYQAKDLFATHGIPVPRGKRVTSVSEAEAWAKELSAPVKGRGPTGLYGPVFVVKSQIHAGGRGKAGGVKLTKSAADVSALAKELLGKVLVTHQTGPAGKEVRQVLIEEGVDIGRELYVSLIVDRNSACPVFIASTEGGMEIEEVAARTPEKIVKLPIDPAFGFFPFHGRQIAFRLNIPKEARGEFIKLLSDLYRLFMEKDASLVEVNPLVITKQNRVIALDGKINFDDNGLFRHEDIRAMRDLSEEEALEIRASEYGLNYIKLDGRIGCMVNGAGLAMATMDVVKLAGEEPANFLDVGGTATKETVAQAFHILLADKNVKGVFVNIFGGIVRCERIAGGIIEAAKEADVRVPLVVRLAGTNAEEGKKMLASSGLKLNVADDLWEGAQKIAAMMKA